MSLNLKCKTSTLVGKTPAWHTYDIDLFKRSMMRRLNKIKANELGLSDNVMEEECRVLLESKGSRLPKNVEFLEGLVVVVVFWNVKASDELQRKRGVAMPATAWQPMGSSW